MFGNGGGESRGLVGHAQHGVPVCAVDVGALAPMGASRKRRPLLLWWLVVACAVVAKVLHFNLNLPTLPLIIHR